jgi:hypothetical protein
VTRRPYNQKKPLLNPGGTSREHGASAYAAAGLKVPGLKGVLDEHDQLTEYTDTMEESNADP